MNISAKILKWAGWHINITVPAYDKCIICVAPHTSNWDFLLGKLAYWSVNRDAGFLMKSSWFFFPLGLLFRAMGGVPVYRKVKRGSLVSQMIERFNSTSHLVLAITPEGTRSLTTKWHTGFLNIAYNTGVPILLGAFDYRKKIIDVSEIFEPTGNVKADMRAIKDFYKAYCGRYPDKFSAAYEDRDIDCD